MLFSIRDILRTILPGIAFSAIALAVCLALPPFPAAAQTACGPSALAQAEPIPLPTTRMLSRIQPIGPNPETVHGERLNRGDLQEMLDSWREAGGIPGVQLALVTDGQVRMALQSGYADLESQTPVREHTAFEGASITKPLFAWFVMRFVESGQLDLDCPLHRYLPHPDLAADPRMQSVTARMVLTHQTGLPNWRDDQPGGELSLLFDPRSGFNYSGEGFQYLALVLQHIAGTDGPGLDEMIRRFAGTWTGMERTAIIPNRSMLARKATPYRNGVELISWEYGAEFGAAYGVNTDATDFAFWLAALTQQSGLRAATYDALFEIQDVEVPVVDEAMASVFGAPQMALGFFAYDVPGIGRIYMHDGNNAGFSSLFLVHPERQWGMVMLANSDQATQALLQFAMMLNAPPTTE